MEIRYERHVRNKVIADIWYLNSARLLTPPLHPGDLCRMNTGSALYHPMGIESHRGGRHRTKKQHRSLWTWRSCCHEGYGKLMKIGSIWIQKRRIQFARIWCFASLPWGLCGSKAHWGPFLLERVTVAGHQGNREFPTWGQSMTCNQLLKTSNLCNSRFSISLKTQLTFCRMFCSWKVEEDTSIDISNELLDARTAIVFDKASFTWTEAEKLCMFKVTLRTMKIAVGLSMF